MAEAFGLAVNILTVLEIGRKFVALAWNVHKDGKDGIPRIASLELTSNDLDEIAHELWQPDSGPPTHPRDRIQERIRQLAERCTKIVARMQETIRDLSTQTRNRDPLSAAVKAFKYKWKQNDIDAFHMEIEDLRNELMLNLIIWIKSVLQSSLRILKHLVFVTDIRIRNGMMKSLENQSRIIQQLSEFRSDDGDLKSRLDYLTRHQEGFVQLMVEVLSSVAARATRSKDQHQLQESMATDLIDDLNHNSQDMGVEELRKLQISPLRLMRVRKEFSSIFWYDSMYEREAIVAEAHQATLKWIFQHPSGESQKWHSFTEWLGSDSQLYWITGKMGSGKSTLMKYVSQELPSAASTARKERRCSPFLLRWAKGQPLFIATFYFWAGSSSKSRVQTSTEGLYRTLLSQILDEYPDAAPHVSPRLWESLCLFNKVSQLPGIAELKSMVTKAVEYVSSRAKICLFIDGLDEFERGKEDLDGLIDWIKTLIQTFPVKMCVASRPWRVFEDALQDHPHLLMEKLTFKDIHNYVSMRFNKDPNFAARKEIETALCDELLHEIVVKAEGVFLWVNLVCTSLLAAMSAGDLVGRLKQILKDLPAKMEKLYDHILDNLEPAYKDHAARYFSLMRLEPNALIFSLADDFGEEREFAISMPQKSLTGAEAQYRMTQLRKRINSRCRGLISLAPKATAEWDTENVHYCHRSVKDYITMSSVQEKLTGMFNAPFDPHVTLCSAYLARWKYCKREPFHHERLRIILGCVIHASKVAGESFIMVRLLDTLDAELGGQLPLSFDSEKDSHFRVASKDVRVHFGRDPWFGGTILSLAVALGAIEYVKYKVGQGPSCLVKTSLATTTPTQDQFRLHLDMTGRSGRSLMREKDQHLSMIVQLQSKAWETSQVEWPLLLDALLAAARPNPAMVNLLLENGADRRLMIRRAAWARSTLNMVFYRLRRFPLFAEISRSVNPDPTVGPDPITRKAWVDTLCVMLQHGAKPDRSDVQFLRNLLGEEVMEAQRLPHLGRHRENFSKLLAIFDQNHNSRWTKVALNETSQMAARSYRPPTGSMPT